MKSALIFLAALVVALLGGCTTPSLNALATPETTVTDPDLVGRWIDAEDQDTAYVVTAEGENAYHLKCIPKDASKRPLEFSFQLCRLADTRFIDMTVTKGAAEELNDKYGTCALTAHVFMKARRKGDDLTVWQVKNDWLTDGLKSGEIKLAHATVRPPGEDKESFVLTGSTAELQSFFRKNADAEEAWDKPTNFKRDTGEPIKSEKKKGAAK